MNERQITYDIRLTGNQTEFVASFGAALDAIEARIARLNEQLRATGDDAAAIRQVADQARAQPGAKASEPGAGAAWSAQQAAAAAVNRQLAAQTAQYRLHKALVGEVAQTLRQMAGAPLKMIAEQLSAQIVDGTQDWAAALKAVEKQLLALLLKMTAELALAGALAAVTGGAATGVGGLAELVFGLPVKHRGGIFGPDDLPRHHRGALATDEHLAVLQIGEGVLPRQAMRQIGPEHFESLRRGELPAGGDTLVVNVTLNGGAAGDANRVAEAVARVIRQEKARGRKML